MTAVSYFEFVMAAVLYLGFVEAAKDDLIERIENLFEETSLDILKL